MPTGASPSQWGPTILVLAVQGSPSGQQQLHKLVEASFSRKVQRRVPHLVRHKVWISVQYERADLVVPQPGGKVRGGKAEGVLLGVDVHLGLGQELLHQFHIRFVRRHALHQCLLVVGCPQALRVSPHGQCLIPQRPRPLLDFLLLLFLDSRISLVGAPIRQHCHTHHLAGTLLPPLRALRALRAFGTSGALAFFGGLRQLLEDCIRVGNREAIFLQTLVRLLEIVYVELRRRKPRLFGLLFLLRLLLLLALRPCLFIRVTLQQAVQLKLVIQHVLLRAEGPDQLH
mmetsp:Transcript_39393/g.94132  ORF Transcript_39393/g.94132 Transcript_39393/m.94132 type:complete len:286 (+) Transcript_39393:1294-2151(+)